MVRKVIPGKDLMRAAGTVTKKLAAWLAEKSYASRCKVGWTISGVVGRPGKRWQLVEPWNVYPR